MNRVLLVEDENLIRLMAEEDLRDIGYEVTSAGNGDEALDLVEGGAQFDLLVTDIRMPGSIDGWRLAWLVREILPGIAVIYVSGYSGEIDDPVDGSRLVKKPYRLEQLRRVLEEAGR